MDRHADLARQSETVMEFMGAWDDGMHLNFLEIYAAVFSHSLRLPQNKLSEITLKNFVSFAGIRLSYRSCRSRLRR